MSIETILSIVAIISTAILGFLQWGTSARHKPTEALGINAETITKLSRRIDELEKRDEEKERRIEELETEVKKWKRGYERQGRYIRSRLPNEELPDFLLDTGDLNKR